MPRRRPKPCRVDALPGVHPHAAGLDIGREESWACVPEDRDVEPVRPFGPFSPALYALADWLAACRIETVAMASTGVYGIPVDELLEARHFKAPLVKARHLKQGPGRKTDKAVARWLATRMRDGLLQASFIPPLEQRDWRDLTRYRTTLGPQHSREVNRGQGGLARANIKQAAVATDIMGVAARAILAVWAGVAPGHDASAGKQRSGKTRIGNQALRTGLTPLAHAAARAQGTYPSALSQRLATRRGKKRAIIAVAHAIVVSAFHRLSRHEAYRELGGHDFDERRREHRVDQLTRRLARLG